MTGTISDPARFQEIVDLCEEQLGIALPSDSCDATLVRDLLTGCKTAAATRRVLAAERAAEDRGGNPDAPDDADMDDDLTPDEYRTTHQFSTEGGRRRRRAVNRLDDGEVAKRLVTKQERFLRSPNFHKPAY
jgi:hypothetical protein